MNNLEQALNVFHLKCSSFRVSFGYDPTHLRCSKAFRSALNCGDYVLTGVRNVYIPVDGRMRVSPRFFIEDIMVDCTLTDTEMKLEAVDVPELHLEMMKMAEYEL